MNRCSFLIFTFIMGMLILAACGSPQEMATIRVAILPVLDTLPMYVAQQEGYFAKNNVTVEFIPVSSAPERDQLMQTDQVDAILNEIVSTLFYNQTDTQIIIVRFARVATSEYPVFRILAAANSGIEKPADLAGVPIGVSEGTVIEYTTDRLLENAGLAPEQITTVAVPKIPDRLALLGSGELQAANLPDPVASLAILQGAKVILDDTSYPEISNSVVAFSADFVAQNPNAVRAFLKSYEQAVEDINKNKSGYIELLLELELLPAPLAESYDLPFYPRARVPSEEQFNDALQWATDKGLIENQPSYSDSVSDEFLP
jgi:NitT/TauT family transport system substrate-binding protein